MCVLPSTLRDDTFHTCTASVLLLLSHIPTGKQVSELQFSGETVGKPFSQPNEGWFFICEKGSKALLAVLLKWQGLFLGSSFDRSVLTSLHI